MMAGGFTRGLPWWKIRTSLPHTAHARTRSLISPGPGSADGISRTTMRSSASRTAAFIQTPSFHPFAIAMDVHQKMTMTFRNTSRRSCIRRIAPGTSSSRSRCEISFSGSSSRRAIIAWTAAHSFSGFTRLEFQEPRI